MEMNLGCCEVNVSADQPMGPRAIYNKGVPEKTDTTNGIGSAQIDNTAFGSSMEIKPPRGRKQSSLWGGFDTQSSSVAVGGNISSRLGLQSAESLEMKALPDLRLPTRVEAFDSGLETGF